ncbi:MAG: hypothetical protein ACTHN5_19065 [Phycisphaerae bacterium]
MQNKNPRGQTRRKFLKQTGLTAGLAVAGLAGLDACATRKTSQTQARHDPPPVAIAADPHDSVISKSPSQWALRHLYNTLARGIRVRFIPTPADAAPDEFCIVAAGTTSPPARNLASGKDLPTEPESFALLPAADRLLLAAGADPMGQVYALTELTDRIACSDDPLAALRLPSPIIERPANRIRSIIRLFVSELEDKPWFYDKDFWNHYLTTLVTHRFNRFNLSLGLGYDFSRNIKDSYFFFAYPFLVNPPGYHVQAVSPKGVALPDEERQRNLDMLRYISDEAAARGLHFQLGLWTHSYHWTNSPDVNYNIAGLNADNQATYSRDALHMLLDACPGIRGITLRTHGESGIPEGSYALWKTIMSGVTGLKNPDGSPRTIELDLHAKSITPQMIDTARATGMQVTISPKFTAEHMGLPYMQASIRPQEAPRPNAGGLMSLSNGSRNFIRYSFGDLLTQTRQYQVITRVWPGTQRLLLWADPLFAAEYGRTWSFCEMDGVEYFDPLSFKGRQGSGQPPAVPAAGRSAYADAQLVVPMGDWRKYLYQYRLLGRLSYNPDAPPETWQRQLQQDFGPAAPNVEAALASASRILPLITTAHVPSAANALFWPEVYVNMSLVDAAHPGPYREAPSPKVFANVTAIDPQLFASVSEYVDALLSQKPLGKITPQEVASQLQQWSQDAQGSLKAATKQSRDINLRRVEVDVTIAAGIGTFLSQKLQAAVAYAFFERTGNTAARDRAIHFYKKARAAWAAFIPLADASYARDLAFGAERQLRGHWHDRLADIDADIAALQSHKPPPLPSAPIPLPAPPRRPSLAVKHAPPRHFQRGTPIPLSISLPREGLTARVWYRPVNQGETYRSIQMEVTPQSGVRLLTAIIPAEETQTDFPLQYYFEMADGSAELAALVPGFGNDFTGQPYFVIEPEA